MCKFQIRLHQMSYVFALKMLIHSHMAFHQNIHSLKFLLTLLKFVVNQMFFLQIFANDQVICTRKHSPICLNIIFKYFCESLIFHSGNIYPHISHEHGILLMCFYTLILNKIDHGENVK